MQRATGGPYKVGEFAQLAGVTVRALHHYDELGLLRPSAHSEAGYRLYSSDDLGRLSQIAALRCIGMPLKDIKDVLAGERLTLTAALALQRRLILRKRDQLDAAIRAIDRAAAVAADGAGRMSALREVMQAMNDQQQWDWVKEHYTPEQLERLGARYDPALHAQWSEQWSTLLRDVEAAKDDDPASPASQDLAQRWDALIRAFTNGEPDIEASLRNVYADARAQSAATRVPLGGDAGTFINKALAILRASR